MYYIYETITWHTVTVSFSTFRHLLDLSALASSLLSLSSSSSSLPSLSLPLSLSVYVCVCVTNTSSKPRTLKNHAGLVQMMQAHRKHSPLKYWIFCNEIEDYEQLYSPPSDRSLFEYIVYQEQQ